MNTKNTNSRVEMFYGAGPHLFDRAKELRKNETKAERLLWWALRNKQLGVKFRRQHPLYKFIADFYCHPLRLVIEVDGGVHNSEEAKEYDENRTYIINEFEIEVVRFSKDEVINNINQVLEQIKQIINKPLNPASFVKSPVGDLGEKNLI